MLNIVDTDQYKNFGRFAFGHFTQPFQHAKTDIAGNTAVPAIGPTQQFIPVGAGSNAVAEKNNIRFTVRIAFELFPFYTETAGTACTVPALLRQKGGGKYKMDNGNK